jgi:hypothetical protein
MQANLKAAMQQGSLTPAQQTGLSALLMHIAGDVESLPQGLQQQIGPSLQQIAKMIKSMPVSGSGSKQALDEHKQQREDAKLQFAQSREGNLQQDRQQKLGLQEKKLMLSMQDYLLREKQAGSLMASALLDQMQTLREAAVPLPPASADEGLQAAVSQNA